MVRVTHGKYTKAVSKKMRPAEEEEDEEEAEDSEEEEYEEEASGEDSDGDEEGGEKDDEEDKPPKSDDEAAADEGEDEEERPAKKKKARKRNQFVDDVAEVRFPPTRGPIPPRSAIVAIKPKIARQTHSIDPSTSSIARRSLADRLPTDPTPTPHLFTPSSVGGRRRGRRHTRVQEEEEV